VPQLSIHIIIHQQGFVILPSVEYAKHIDIGFIHTEGNAYPFFVIFHPHAMLDIRPNTVPLQGKMKKLSQ